MYRRNISGESGWWGGGGASPGGSAPAAGHVLDIPAAAAAAESSWDDRKEEEGEGSAPTTWENIVAWQRGETDTIRRVGSAAETEEEARVAPAAVAVAEEVGGSNRRVTLPHAGVRSTEGAGDVVVQVEGGGVAVPPGVEPQRRQRAAAAGARARGQAAELAREQATAGFEAPPPHLPPSTTPPAQAAG